MAVAAAAGGGSARCAHDQAGFGGSSIGAGGGGGSGGGGGGSGGARTTGGAGGGANEGGGGAGGGARKTGGGAGGGGAGGGGAGGAVPPKGSARRCAAIASSSGVCIIVPPFSSRRTPEYAPCPARGPLAWRSGDGDSTDPWKGSTLAWKGTTLAFGGSGSLHIVDWSVLSTSREGAGGAGGALARTAPRQHGRPVLLGRRLEAQRALEHVVGHEVLRRERDDHAVGRVRGRRHERRRVEPPDGLAGELDAEDDAHPRERGLLGDREGGAERQRAVLLVAVDAQRVGVERDGLALRDAPRAQAVHEPDPARAGQGGADAGHVGVQPVHHDPLVAAQEADALVGGRGLEVLPVEVVRQVDDALAHERLALDAAEEALARGPPLADGAEAGAAPLVERIDQAGLAGALGHAHAERVLLPAHAAVRPLVHEGHLLDAAPLPDDHRLVEHRLGAVEDGEPHRERLDDRAARRVRVAREEHVGAAQVRREVGREPDAPRRAVAVVELGPEDGLGRYARHRLVRREGERGLGDDGHPDDAPVTPGDRAHGRVSCRHGCIVPEGARAHGRALLT